MSEWEAYTLGDIADIFTGFPFKGNKYSNHGIRVLRGENVTIGDLRWDTIKCWNEPIEQFEKYFLREGDIVIGMDGSRVGKNRAQIRSIDLPLLLAQRVACVRAKVGFSQDMLAYLIKSPKFEEFVSSVHTGTTIPHISQKQIEEYKVHLPDDLPTQIFIAEILSSLDDKIELNNSINKNLEDLAQALFKHWFVDFEFPNENGVPYKSSGGKMVESELGEIPMGWEISRLNDILNIKHGFAFKGDFIRDEENENILITPGNFKIGGGFNFSKYRYYHSDFPKEYLLNHGDIIVTMTDLSKAGDTLGYSAIVPMVSNKGFLHNQRIGKIEFKDFKGSMFIYWLLRQEGYRNFVLGSATGTTVRHTSPSRIGEYKFAKPNNELLILIESFMNDLYNIESNNLWQIFELKKLRDTLLPKLISGEIEVKEILLQTENAI